MQGFEAKFLPVVKTNFSFRPNFLILDSFDGTFKQKLNNTKILKIGLETTVDGSLPANLVNDRRVANAVTLKSTFLSTVKSAIIQKYLIMEPPEK